MEPKVSVIIPTFNASLTIIDCLDSVFSQTYKNFEVIVVDNGSNDQTLDRLAQYRERLEIRKSSITGSGPTRNFGAGVASGKYLAFLDADDCWKPSKLTRQVEVYEHSLIPNLIVGTYANFIGGKRKIIGSSPRSSDDWEAMYELKRNGTMPAPLSTWLIRKDLFEEIGGFDPDYIFSQDLEFLTRAANNGVEIKIIREPLCDYMLSYFSGSAANYINQYMTSQFIKLPDEEKADTSLHVFLQRSKMRYFNSYRKAYAGKFFRLLIIDYSTRRFVRFLLHAVISFLLDPISFLKKFLNQSKFTWNG
jgi:glycosyltransferase involved in cell wall biosynthesis